LRFRQRRIGTSSAIAGLSSAFIGLVVGACAVGDGIVRPRNMASIVVHAVFAETSSPYAAAPSRIDRVRVLAIRPSSGETVDQAEEPVTAGQQSVPVELSVELEESPEQLLIRVELWSENSLAYAGEQLMLVDAAKSVNESPPILLEPASPSLAVQPTSLDFALPRGDATASQSITIANVGVGVMNWQVSSDAAWLSASQTSGNLQEGGTAVVLARVSSSGLDPGGQVGTLTFAAPGALGSPRSVSVSLVVEANQPPTADAGRDRTVTDADNSGDEAVKLDGTASSDPDGTIVGYVWTVGGTQIATGVTPTVTLGVGTRTITLTVTDDNGATDNDQVQITVAAPANQPPTADAGTNRTVIDGDDSGAEPVTLDGTGSFDPDGTVVSYRWTEGGTQIATGATPTVTFAVGSHAVTLTVTDDDGATDSDQVQVTVTSRENQPPTANAGPDRTVTDGDDSGDEPVTLDGTGSSDPDGTIASYVWTEGDTQIATGGTPTVTLGVGAHAITLTVTDDDGATDSDQVRITVAAADKQPPTANAGPNRTVTDADDSGAEPVTLDGTDSYDPDGVIVSYRWTEGGAQIAAGAAPTVTLAVGTHTITLTVTDDDGLTDSDQVQITVLAPAAPDLAITTGAPTVTPGSVPAGGAVTLSSWAVKNQGGVPSGNFSNGFYLSTDAVITTSDVLLSGNSNYSLAPGESFVWGGPTLTIPASTAPGSYYIGILVDRANQVSESNESNNAVSRAITVTSSSATLTVTVDGVGSVSSSGVTPAINCYAETCSATYPIGTTVTLVATQENPDFLFESWFGTGSGFTCTTSTTCVVTMDQDRTVRAWFSVPGIISVNPSTASFTMAQGGTPTPSSRTITVSNIGDRPVQDVVIHQSYSPNVGDWLSAAIDRTVIDTLTPGTMTLSVNANNLDPGTYNAAVYVGDFVVTTGQVNVTLTVQSPAPTISNLSISLIQVNDTVSCSNGGSSYRASFRYSDPDGDVTLADAIIRDYYVFSTGQSGTIVWPGAGYYSVGGDGFSGSIAVILCTRFNAATSIQNSFTVEDGAGHLSNTLSATQTRPAGANVPPLDPASTPSSTGAPTPGRDETRTEGRDPSGT